MAITRKKIVNTPHFLFRRPPSITISNSNISEFFLSKKPVLGIKNANALLNDINANDLLELVERVNKVPSDYIEKIKKMYLIDKIKQQVSMTFYEVLLRLFEKDILKQLFLSCRETYSATATPRFYYGSDKPSDSDLGRYVLHLSKANRKEIGPLLEFVLSKATHAVTSLIGKRCIVVAKAILKYNGYIEIDYLKKALISASIMNHVELVKTILETEQVDPNDVITKHSKDLLGIYTFNESAISNAVHHGSYDVMELYSQLECNFDTDEIVKNARIYELPMLSFLLKQGIEPFNLFIHNNWITSIISQLNNDQAAFSYIKHSGKLNEYFVILNNTVKDTPQAKHNPAFLISALFKSFTNNKSVEEFVNNLNKNLFATTTIVKFYLEIFEKDTDKMKFNEETKELQRRIYVVKAILYLFQIKNELIYVPLSSCQQGVSCKLSK